MNVVDSLRKILDSIPFVWREPVRELLIEWIENDSEYLVFENEKEVVDYVSTYPDLAKQVIGKHNYKGITE